MQRVVALGEHTGKVAGGAGVVERVRPGQPSIADARCAGVHFRSES